MVRHEVCYRCTACNIQRHNSCRHNLRLGGDSAPRVHDKFRQGSHMWIQTVVTLLSCYCCQRHTWATSRKRNPANLKVLVRRHIHVQDSLFQNCMAPHGKERPLWGTAMVRSGIETLDEGDGKLALKIRRKFVATWSAYRMKRSW
jgi:hypothetical protein